MSFNNLILPFLQIFNIIITVALNLSPIFIFIPLIKGRQHYKNIPLLVLIFNSLNSICWGCYWYRMDFVSPVVSNILCYISSSSFFIIYLFFFAKKIIQKFFLYVIILIIIETTIIYISLYIINLKIFGKILIILNILMFVAPGQNIIRVIKENNHKLIPIATTLVATICSGSWLLFGKIINDINCIIPNMIGLIFSIFTSLIWLYFYLKAKIKNNKNQLYSENVVNNNKVEIK